jgi:hypothetical protein
VLSPKSLVSLTLKILVKSEKVRAMPQGAADSTPGMQAATFLNAHMFQQPKHNDIAFCSLRNLGHDIAIGQLF